MFWGGGGQEVDTRKLRENMVKRMIKLGVLKTPAIIDAFSSVPRHTFLQGLLPPRQAYVDKPVMVKYPVSTASQPQVVAYMLESLDVEPGMKVLEVGTASGYNAALLAHLTGDPGLVYTIEYEEDLVERAREIFSELGLETISVTSGDGARGWPDGEIFQRIIITAEVDRFYPELLSQLARGGIALAPYNFYDVTTLILRLYKSEEFWGEVLPYPVSFVPLRGKEVGTKQKADSSLHRIWLSLGGRLRFSDPSSHRPWGLFLSILSQWLKGVKRDGSFYWKNWQEMGQPSSRSFKLLFSADGILTDVEWRGSRE